MRFLTDFADQAVLLPLVVAVSIMLFVQGWRRGAGVWLGVVATTFGVMLVLKLGFMGCGPVFAPWELHSPSGHTAAAAVVTGGLVAILGGGALAVLTAAVPAAAFIALSRVEVGVHSMPEVLLGGVVGLTGAVLLVRLAGRKPPSARPVPLLGVVIAVAAVMHGVHLPAEAAIARTARPLLRFVPVCRTHIPISPAGAERAAGA